MSDTPITEEERRTIVQQFDSNAAGMRSYIDAQQEVNAEVQEELATMRNEIQSMRDLAAEMQRTMGLAIATVRGTGPTA